MRRLIQHALVFLQLFLTISAIGGGIGLIATHGLGMPLSLLKTSGFSSYFYPGLILALIVGGTHTTAFFLGWVRSRLHYPLSGIAAFGLLIWIFTELYLIQTTHWLQVFVFGLGILELTLIFLLIWDGTVSENRVVQL